MDILFVSDRLRKLCQNNAKAVKEFGPMRAKKIALRLQQLQAAPTLEAMRSLPGRCHEETANLRGKISLDLDGPYRLMFEQAHDETPTKDDGGLDWSGVTAVRILGVEDPHE